MAADIFALTQSALVGMDVELVDVERAPGGLLRVTIDRPEGVRIEDCERVSRHLSRVYEVEEIDYRRLEVGSPGIDRPLKRPEDFLRFMGQRIEVRLRQPVENRKVFVGILQPVQVEPTSESGASGFSGTAYGLEFENQSKEIQVLEFSFDDVERAKLDPILDFKGKKR